MIKGQRITGDSLHILTDADGAVIEHIIPLEQITVWSELLGYTDALDALDAIIQENRTRDRQPGIDPRTQENVWTELYLVKAHMEQVREREAEKALREGKASDPRSPALRSALAVRGELSRMTSDGESVIDKCRSKACARMGILGPDKKATAVRSQKLDCDATPKPGGCLTQDDRQRCAEILNDHLPLVEWQRAHVAHIIAGTRHDPLDAGPAPRVRKEPQRVDLATVLGRYTGGSQ